ncbi:hypothetical protein D3C81_1774380 [compost metagenome]
MSQQRNSQPVAATSPSSGVREPVASSRQPSTSSEINGASASGERARNQRAIHRLAKDP